MPNHKFSPEELERSDDWRDFYLHQGTAMLSLADASLKSGDERLIRLGLKVVEGAFFEEDEENPDHERSLGKLDFASLLNPLAQLLKKKEFAPQATYGLWVCCQEGAEVRELDVKALEAAMESPDKAKVHGESVQTRAFRVLVHVLCQKKENNKIIDYLKSNSKLKKTLFQELTTYAASRYDASPFLPMILDGITAKGDSRPRESVELLWQLLKAGVDISKSIPTIIEHQAHLAGFTDVMKVIAAYFLKDKDYERLEKQLFDPDEGAALRAYRGLLMADRDEVNCEDFLKRPRIKERVEKIAEKNGLPKLGER